MTIANAAGASACVCRWTKALSGAGAAVAREMMEVAKAKLEKEKVFILQNVVDFAFCVIGNRTKESSW